MIGTDPDLWAKSKRVARPQPSFYSRSVGIPPRARLPWLARMPTP